MQIEEFKIRCSAIGKIMTNSRTKGELSKTAQGYCKDWLKGQIFKRQRHISTKYTEKGNIMEDNSIDFIAKMLGYGMLIKNEEHFSNDFMKGTPDILPGNTDIVIDAKNSWSHDTFPLFESKATTLDYYWQLQGYMHLTGRKKGVLAYVLSDTPDHLIEREAKWYCIKNGYEAMDNDIFNEFYDRMNYSDIEDKYKIKVFESDYHPESIQAIEDRVWECRNYISKLKKQIL